MDTPCFSCKISIVSKNSTLSRSCILFCKAKFAIKCFEISATVFEEYDFLRVWFLESMRVWFLFKEFVFYGNFTYLAMKIHLQVGFSWFYVVTVIYSLLGIKHCYRKMIWLPVPSFQPIRKKVRSSVHRVIQGGECVMVDWIPSLCYKTQLNPAWGKQITRIQPYRWRKRNPKKSESMIWKNRLTRSSG